jgi:hypothetical protein
VAIEFHCEHCNHLIKAPDDAGGRTGNCPHCHNATYVPRPVPESDVYDLAPLDDSEEARRVRESKEAAAYQRNLLHERNVPGEAPRGQKGMSSFVSPTKQLTGLIVAFVEAMSTGKLEKAEEVATELSRQKPSVTTILDEMSHDDLSAYGLPALPKPVLTGFLKQLRQKL